MTESCLYEGTIRHRRMEPRREFVHNIALAYVDLDELPALLGGRLVSRLPGLVRFRRRDYLGERSVPLDLAVRRLVRDRTGTAAAGPIRLLTQLRSFGHCFNPVSFYYCFDAGGEHVEAVVAEVTNTPWGERHSYVIGGEHGNEASVGREFDNVRRTVLSGQFDKKLHVSPFMGMAHRYEMRCSPPAQRLSVHIASARDGVVAFDASLSLRRQALTAASMRRMTGRYPLATVRVMALIYAHALGLKLAGVPIHPHPNAGRR